MAIKLDPKLIQAYLNRTGAENKLKKYKEAIADFNYVISVDPEYPDIHAYRLYSNMHLKRVSGGAMDDCNY